MESENDEGGVKVGAMNCTPIALGGGAWDTKEILGEVDVAPDGSVYFEIPARTPVYFQPIDENGCAVTTMRSWTASSRTSFIVPRLPRRPRHAESRAAQHRKGQKARKAPPVLRRERGIFFPQAHTAYSRQALRVVPQRPLQGAHNLRRRFQKNKRRRPRPNRWRTVEGTREEKRAKRRPRVQSARLSRKKSQAKRFSTTRITIYCSRG